MHYKLLTVIGLLPPRRIMYW